jgi:hypothetical protein
LDKRIWNNCESYEENKNFFLSTGPIVLLQSRDLAGGEARDLSLLNFFFGRERGKIREKMEIRRIIIQQIKSIF